jgi:hypothetical protein
MTINIAETVRRFMGWCPNVTQSRYKSMQPVDFEYTSQIPHKGSNVENVQSNNVMFYANNSLLTICFGIGFSLILNVFRNLDYAILIPIVVVIYFFFYFIEVKTFQASVSIDKSSVHLKSIGLKNITLNYKDIESVTPNKLIKTSSTFIAIILIIPVAFLAYLVVSKEWQFIITIAPLLPLLLLVIHKQDNEYYDLDTQLYIEYKNKKWYELTPYYSIITDEMTASRIQAAIEHNMGVK